MLVHEMWTNENALFDLSSNISIRGLTLIPKRGKEVGCLEPVSDNTLKQYIIVSKVSQNFEIFNRQHNNTENGRETKWTMLRLQFI